MNTGVQVSRETFFSTVGQLDVMPSCAGQRWDEERGYKSVWRTRSGEVIGESDGRSHLGNERYFSRLANTK